MPVSNPGMLCRLPSKFSEKFYARLGHDVADELVDWFNKVDTTYHSDLRELNELNYARFEAKLGQRVSELRSEIREGLGQTEVRMSQLETRLIRWMFLFWVGTVGSMIALLRFWA